MTAIFARPDFHAALSRLRDKHLLRDLAYSGGRWTAGSEGKSFKVTDPSAGATIAWVASLGADETSAAIDTASRALPAWRAKLPQERARILRTWYDLMLAGKDDLALIMTLEQGKALWESLSEIDYAASFVEWYAEEGKRLNAESVTGHLPGAEMIVRREALGVVGLVTPWNFPSAMVTRKAAAACSWTNRFVLLPTGDTGSGSSLGWRAALARCENIQGTVLCCVL